MQKSLGDYNIKKSSSQDVRNILWTVKNQFVLKSKNKTNNLNNKSQSSSATNIIYYNGPQTNSHLVKVFKIKKVTSTVKSKNKTNNLNKKSQSSSLSNCTIQHSFKRPGR